MKKLLWAAFAVLILVNSARAQSGNSNIGTEFWTGWMSHINGVTGAAASQMNLYIACDVATTVTITSADGATTATVAVQAGVIKKYPVPSSYYLGDINGLQLKGIHITSKNPVAVYAHIYASSVSGATLLLPVNTLSNDYYSLNYTQLSNSSPSYSTFMVIGTEDNTTVQITPTAKLIDNSAANTMFTITLNKGQVYQGISTTDLTGTKITSVVNGGTSCKKIAVFSGSNKIYIGKPNMSSDNLFQQVYPTSSWGKTFVTVPLKDRNYDIMRIVKSDPAAVVKLDGNLVNFTNSFYYDFNSQATHYISSDKPIQVIQYAVTQGNSINNTAITGDVGDPEMIYLNPLEQTIDHVILYSATEYLITKSFINVVLPTTAVSSFLLDGAATTGFATVPSNTAYSYKQFPVTSGTTHTISASQGFNAIAYGFGTTESYGYAAGTNVKNLNEYVQYANPSTNAIVTAGCTGTSLNPQVILPYITTSITWDLGNGTNPVVQTNPVYKSTFTKNGVQLYLYEYGTAVAYTAGAYAIKITVFNPNSTLCGSNEEVDLNFNVADPPSAKFSSRDTTCVTDTIGFKDLSLGNGSAIQSWHWDFGNGDTSIVQNPVYKYLTPGDYTVNLIVTIPTGCQSIYTKKVHIRTAAVAAFAASSPDCETQGVTFTDKSTPGEGKIVKWTWDYGDGSPVDNRTDALPFTHVYATAGTYTIKLLILTDKSCFSTTTTKAITVHPHPIVAFTLPDVCLANAAAQFTDGSTIADNSASQFKYTWNFGDANATVANPNVSILQNPTHQFSQPGTYHVSLTVTSKDTCSSTLIKDFLVSGQANFTAAASACPADTVIFTDKTNGATPAASSWHWDFGTGDTTNVQNPKYPFANPGNYTVTLTVKGHNGCAITSYGQVVHINKKPTANFTSSTPSCETQNITFTDTSIPNEGNIVSWKWDFGDGTTSTLQNPVHVFAPFNTYNVTLVVTSDLGCSSVAFTKAVVVNPTPVASFPLPDACLNDGAAKFAAKADPNGVTYKWDFGEPAKPATNTATGLNVTHTYTNAGDYYVRLTVTTANNCVSDTLKKIHINGSTPVPDFSVNNAAGLCSSDSVSIVNKTTIPNFGDEVTSIEVYYDFANNPTTKVRYDRPKSGQIFTHLYPLENVSSRNYTIRMVAYSGLTCISPTPKDMVITVQPVPEVTFVLSFTDICQDAGNINLLPFVTNLHTNGPSGTGKFYLDGNTSLSNSFDPSSTTLGAHTITYTYTYSTPGSCAYSVTQNFNVAPVPTADAGPDVEVIAGESVTLHGVATGSGYKVSWTPTTGLSDSTILSPIATPKKDTWYKLTITLTTGGVSCPVTDSVFVKLLSLPLIPNTFTPNGDGHNDTWEIKYLDRYTTSTIKVYNRAGDLVFSDVGYKVPWDGTYKNTPLPVGTYFYVIDPGHKLAVMTGSVNLVR